MLRKANWDKTLEKSLKFSYCRKSIRKQIRPSCRKNLSTSFCACLVSWKQRNLEIRANIPKSCRRPVVSLLYATKSAFTAPNLCWVCALASPVTFLTGDHVMQIGFGQISPSASSTRDLGTRLRYDNRGTREKRSAHACLPCFRRIFAIEIIRDNKTN